MFRHGEGASLGAHGSRALHAKSTGEVLGTRLTPLQLSRGGLGQAAGWKADDIGRWKTNLFADGLLDASDDVVVFCLSGLEHEHEFFAGRTRTAKGHHVALSHAVHLGGMPLDGLRMEVPTIEDDEVLDATGHIDFVIEDVAEVSGLEPAVFSVRGAGGLVILEVPAGDARTLEAELTLNALGQSGAVVIERGEVVPGKGGAARHVLEHGATLDGIGDTAFSTEGLCVDESAAVDLVDGLEAHGEGGFSHAVCRQDARPWELAVLSEQVEEGVHGGGLDGLRATAEYAAAGQVPCLEVLGLHLSDGERVGEVGCEGDGSTVAMHGVHPDARLLDEAHRGDKHRAESAGDGGDHEANEAHVVVERQPAHAEIDVGVCMDAVVDDRAAVGDERAVGHDHALGIRGRARGVLQKCNVVGCDLGEGVRGVRPLDLFDLDELLERWDLVHEAPKDVL